MRAVRCKNKYSYGRGITAVAPSRDPGVVGAPHGRARARPGAGEAPGEDADRIGLEEWMDHHEMSSLYQPDDALFERQMREAWGLVGAGPKDRPGGPEA